MERLTARNEMDGAYYQKCFKEPCLGMGDCVDMNCEQQYDVCEKLAAYKDTGLTPEEAQKYRELENRLKDIYGDHNDLLRYAVEGLEIYRLARSKAIILTDDDVDRWNAYKSIGPVEECRKAVEKQRAKKPNLEGDGYADGHMVYDTWICPCCGISYEVDYDDYKYCPDCGQYIDWSE